MKALISVYDKTGIVPLARSLADMGAELLSTGGTFRTIVEAGLPVMQVSDYTGFPEVMEGRVKTLHPAIHGGLLARRDKPDHMEQLEQQGLDTIDMVVVNLYPFLEVVRKPDLTLDEALENIDIGGPTMLRAAAKNHQWVTVVVDPDDYDWVAASLAEGGPSPEQRRSLAQKAFQHVSFYDSAVAAYLSEESSDEPPETLGLAFQRLSALRYGENPHQKAALYAPALPSVTGVCQAEQLHGRELSFNNYMDADAAWRTVSDFSEQAVVVIKHANPCGLSCHTDMEQAYLNAYDGDPVSAFGGIVGFNRTVTAATAQAMSPIFYEVVVAPGYEPEALEILRQKRNLRILAVPKNQGPQGTGGSVFDVRPLTGGLLVQTGDTLEEDPSEWKTVTQRAPTEQERRDLAFAWRAVKHVKSNAILLAKDGTMVGMGAGQPNRVTSVHLALRAASDKGPGSVLASDAFFPFPDGLELAAQGRVTAVVQPGGSIRDQEVIDAANQAGVAMLTTGVRHFRH